MPRSLRRPEVDAARKLRRTMSLPEVLLWQRLKSAQTGLSFRKQHPVGPYVADFYYAKLSLVIEVDGEAHGRGIAPHRDEQRNAFMTDNGYRVLRITASDILRDVDAVVEGIVAFAAAPPPPPAAVPLPASGEEFS